jgi:hypothetical protein
MRMGKRGLAVNLRRLYESNGPARTVALLEQALVEKDVKPEDFSLRELAEAFCGEQWVNAMHPGNLRQGHGRFVPLLEAGDAVNVTAFSNITGQLFITKIWDGFKLATNYADQLVETIGTNLDGEKLPGIGNIADEGQEVAPGMPYPETSLGEQYIETPRTVKKGEIISVTKEAIYFDRTGVLLPQVARLGFRMGQGKAVTIYDGIIGATNTHKWKGTTYNTYQAASPWINTKSSNPLNDYTAVNEAEQLLMEMTDPDTGRPLMIDWSRMSIICMPWKKHTAKRVINATSVKNTNPGYATSGNPIATESPNPLDNYNLVTDPLLYQRVKLQQATASKAREWWFMGDFPGAFVWMQNWDITVVQAPPNSIAEFERDIVLRYKGSYRGTFGVRQPRLVVWNYDAA